MHVLDRYSRGRESRERTRQPVVLSAPQTDPPLPPAVWTDPDDLHQSAGAHHRQTEPASEREREREGQGTAVGICEKQRGELCKMKDGAGAEKTERRNRQR